MAARISHTSVDARDAYAQSVFWAAVLGWVRDPDDPDGPGDDECLILDPDGTQRLLFIAVPEDKQVKNRLHLDVQPVEGTPRRRAGPATGARRRERRRPAPPRRHRLGRAGRSGEGNEFCILRSDAERATSDT